MKYNRLEILDKWMEGKLWIVLCVCDCGGIIVTRLQSIKSGGTTSCGCARTESNKKGHNITHGLTGHPLQGIWFDVKKRCYNKNCAAYHNYGGRGVTMCKEWKDNFVSFYKWAIANGWKKGLELDKDIKSPFKVGKIYSPKYCSFVSRKDNSRRKKNSIMIWYRGEIKNVSEWCELLGIDAKLVRQRITKYKWDAVDALTTPCIESKRNRLTKKHS